jgi:catechol 2,3-dioxygenase-like lactoylglutathione lyase family enzyme
LSEAKPVYRSVVLFVNDVEISKHFYSRVLGQTVVMDFGQNVGFEGGLAIWDKDYALNLIFNDKTRTIQVGANNAEIYFEVNDLDALFLRVTQEHITVIHPIRTHPWGQKAFRIYDPDLHIIEFAESMENVIRRLHDEGLSLQEISQQSMMPLEFINMVLTKQ